MSTEKIFQYIHASVSHPERCEDAILVSPGGEFAPVYAVIDGMGGHQRTTASGETLTGREAALAIREVFIEDLERFPTDTSADPNSETEARMIAALQRANDLVYTQLNGSDETEIRARVGAVATVVTVCEGGARLLITQVGDTRAYLFTEGELIQLLKDEDNMEYVVKNGLVSEEDAEKVSMLVNTWDGVSELAPEGTITIGDEPYELYMAWRWFVSGNAALRIPGANVVINSLGTGNDTLEVQRTRIEVLAGDVLLLGSDGLYKNLSEAEIIAGLAHPDDPAAYLGELALARSQDSDNGRMNPDDISVVIVRL